MHHSEKGQLLHKSKSFGHSIIHQVFQFLLKLCICIPINFILPKLSGKVEGGGCQRDKLPEKVDSTLSTAFFVNILQSACCPCRLAAHLNVLAHCE